MGHNKDKINDINLLSLMGACAWRWHEDEGFFWLDDALAEDILAAPASRLPRSIKAFEERLCKDALSTRNQAIAMLGWNGAKYQIDYQIRTFDGRNIWVEERAKRIAGKGKTPSEIIGTITNIQTRKLREEQAGYHAAFDSLTGLWNKTRMAEGLDHMLASAQRYDRQAALLGMQITNISDINQNYGYEAGDRLLKSVAKRLKLLVRSPDICGRISGNCFGIGVSDCDGLQMEMVAERIYLGLTETPYGSPFGDLYANFAIGGVAMSQKSTSAIDAIEQVFTALSHSRTRQGLYVAFTKDLPDIKPRQIKTEIGYDDIISALNERRVNLAYQPIVNAKTRQTHHFECLLRLKRKDGELVSAADFIIAAEKLDLVHLLDRRALEIAGQTLRQKPDIRIALNISAATVKTKEYAKDYLSALKALGRDCERIIIEMTETLALEDPSLANYFSVEARTLGCHFSIDDFGAGYTTFRNLMAIEADEIKIDGSFIRDLSITPHKQVFVRMMVDLASTFSVKTVAEMVGSREDADLLTRLGVDYLQGYMFGLPAPTPEIGNNTKIVVS